MPPKSKKVHEVEELALKEKEQELNGGSKYDELPRAWIPLTAELPDLEGCHIGKAKSAKWRSKVRRSCPNTT